MGEGTARRGASQFVQECIPLNNQCQAKKEGSDSLRLPNGAYFRQVTNQSLGSRFSPAAWSLFLPLRCLRDPRQSVYGFSLRYATKRFMYGIAVADVWKLSTSMFFWCDNLHHSAHPDPADSEVAGEFGLA